MIFNYRAHATKAHPRAGEWFEGKPVKETRPRKAPGPSYFAVALEKALSAWATKK